MRRCTISALAAHALLMVVPCWARSTDELTTTTTIHSTTTVLTITTTVTSGQSVYTSDILETTALPQPTMVVSGPEAYAGQAFQSSVLNSTNYFRAQHQAQAVTWDATLADFAQNYAQGCDFKHSDGAYGENLASGYPNPALAIDAWAGEEKKYNYAKPKFSDATGHYTQLVWKNTTSVGCGAVECSSSSVKGWYLVCEYSPRGNVVGQFEDSVGKPGESKTGQPGFGAASKSGGCGLLGALIAVCLVSIMYL